MLTPARCNDPDWSQLSEFEQLALLVHSPESEHRFMGIMHVAYCDESEYHKTPGVYVISGFLGRAPDWFEFGRTWRLALRERGLEAFGFHMSACERGDEPPYDGMERAKRHELQQIFIDLINAAPIWGMAIAIELDRYRETKEAFNQRVGSLHKPYFIAFLEIVDWMVDVLEEGGFPKEERIAFVFDRQQEYEGGAKELYDKMMKSWAIPNRHRLGSITFDSRMESVQLQAADVWAYEAQRYIRDVKLGDAEARWQFERLHQTDRAKRRISIVTNEAWDAFVRGHGWV